MRITDSIGSRNILQNVGMLNEKLERSIQQASSGKKLSQLHDSPSASSENLQLDLQLDRIDQYEASSNNGGFFLNVANSSLTSLYNVTNSIFTRGSAAANSSNNQSTMDTLASEIRSMRDQIFSLANTQVKGRYIFAGALIQDPAFTMSGDTVTYRGDTEVSKVDISSGLQIQVNVPGDQVFSSIFANVEALVTAVDSRDFDAVKNALGQFSASLSSLNQVRSRVGVDLGKLEDATITRQGLQTNIENRQSQIRDTDMLKTIAELNRNQTALQAAISAGGIIGQKSLMDYLG